MAWTLRFAQGALAVAVVVSACAKGVGSNDFKIDQDGPSSSSTGGMGGSGGAATGTGGTGGTLPPCDESPCKLKAPQCGCPGGEKCTLLPSNARACEADGDKPIGDACGGSGTDDCMAGGMCLTLGGLSTCFEFCDDDNDCNAAGPGGKCALELDSGDTFCSVNCDPISGAGCPLAGSKCDPLATQDAVPIFYTSCVASGTGVQDSLCTDSSDCAGGFYCFSVTSGSITEDKCLQWCNMAAPVCPGATTCQSLPTPLIVGTIEYGACL